MSLKSLQRSNELEHSQLQSEAIINKCVFCVSGSSSHVWWVSEVTLLCVIGTTDRLGGAEKAFRAIANGLRSELGMTLKVFSHLQPHEPDSDFEVTVLRNPEDVHFPWVPQEFLQFTPRNWDCAADRTTIGNPDCCIFDRPHDHVS